MSKPRNMKLYNTIKKRIYEKYQKHSAYRSGILVKTYKKEFKNKYGKNKAPYIGKKTNKRGLKRWFNEKWVNQRGEIGYKYKGDVYRPSKRITKKTPKTFKELNKKRIESAKIKKRKYGRVKKF